ncbi:hypothetical protein KI387_032553 [Taxus chinensis]|uniref:Uncharacterized protein n=1 Tax=Taxus chinensis TaxID=29808 RepID=A0AA38BVQ2_TAXCH|nr:hypothetical protein KI387_032553 [Taxus chinensis]
MTLCDSHAYTPYISPPHAKMSPVSIARYCSDQIIATRNRRQESDEVSGALFMITALGEEVQRLKLATGQQELHFLCWVQEIRVQGAKITEEINILERILGVTLGAGLAAAMVLYEHRLIYRSTAHSIESILGCPVAAPAPKRCTPSVGGLTTLGSLPSLVMKFKPKSSSRVNQVAYSSIAQSSLVLFEGLAGGIFSGASSTQNMGAQNVGITSGSNTTSQMMGVQFSTTVGAQESDLVARFEEEEIDVEQLGRACLEREKGKMIYMVDDEEVENLDIEHTEESEWVSPMVISIKKDGRIKICVDYRELNVACVIDPFPTLFTEEILEGVVGCEIYSFTDGFSGYHQVRIAKEDQEKTNFTTEWGIFAYKVMPFG